MKQIMNHRFAFAALLLLGAFLRFYTLGSKSIWLDEAFTLWVAKHPFPAVWDWIARIDQHPPLFYLLLSGWVKLFGDSETAIRSLPALLGTLTLPLFYLLANRVASKTGSLFALLLLAINPFHIHYAQETRMYTLLSLAGCGAIYFLLRVLDDSRPEIREWRLGDWRLGDWNVTGLAFFQAVGMWTHNTFVVFFPFALVIGLGLSAFRIPHSALRKLLLAQFFALLLWLPWLVNFVRQSLKVDQEFWIRPLNAIQIYETVRRLLFEHFTIRPIVVLWILFALLCASIGFWQLRRANNLAGSLLLSFWLTPFFAEMLLSLRRPLLHPPSLVWTSIPLYLLLAIGITNWLHRWQGIRPKIVAAILIGIIAINGLGLHNYYFYVEKEQWRDAAQFVSERANPSDLILFNATWVQLPFEYYAQRQGLSAELRGLPVDLFERGVTEPKMSRDDLPYLRQLLANKKHVWLVYSHDWYTDPDQLVLSNLRSQMTEIQSQQFQGVRIFEFQQ